MDLLNSEIYQFVDFEQFGSNESMSPNTNNNSDLMATTTPSGPSSPYQSNDSREVRGVLSNGSYLKYDNNHNIRSEITIEIQDGNSNHNSSNNIIWKKQSGSHNYSSHNSGYNSINNSGTNSINNSNSNSSNNSSNSPNNSNNNSNCNSSHNSNDKNTINSVKTSTPVINEAANQSSSNDNRQSRRPFNPVDMESLNRGLIIQNIETNNANNNNVRSDNNIK
jgi:hypothetical protein